jgi:thiamine pyrophosphate-dependent acetolactate synthase large subunit-like protein
VAAELSRSAVAARLLAERGGLLVVSGLGSTTWDLAAAGDHPGNFYLWGAMGGAAAMGLGLALAQPRRPVLVLTGDGEMLMGLGALVTLAAQAPANLSVVVLNNRRYGETGMQESHTALRADLAALARGAGFAEALTVMDEAGVAALAGRLTACQGLLFADIRVAADDPPRVLPERDAVTLKRRFRRALGLA